MAVWPLRSSFGPRPIALAAKPCGKDVYSVAVPFLSRNLVTQRGTALRRGYSGPIHAKACLFPARSLYPKDSGNDRNGIPGFYQSVPAGKIMNHGDFRIECDNFPIPQRLTGQDVAITPGMIGFTPHVRQ
jgi:hypothetical protein